MSGVRAYSRTKGLASSAGNLTTLGGLALTNSFTPITDSAGNYSALELNKATTDGFIAVNAPNPANTAGIYYKVAGNVIGDFRADATNGFAVVTQGSYPFSIYTQNTAVLAARFTTTGNLVIGHTTASARLHVRGDGTNPIFRAENLTGTVSLQMLNSGALTLNEGSLTIGNGNISVTGKVSTLGGYNNTSGTIITSLDLANTIVNAAGSANNRIVSIAYTVNNSGVQTGSLTGIFLNVTETNRNGQSSDFVNFQTNSVQRFRVDSTGAVFASNTIQTVDLQLQGGQQAIWNTSGRILLTNSSFNGFDRLQLGGTTNLFVALKRNGTELQVRLADDSAFAPIAIGNIVTAAAAIPSTHKVQINIGGTTYYLLASNV